MFLNMGLSPRVPPGPGVVTTPEAPAFESYYDNQPIGLHQGFPGGFTPADPDVDRLS
jgi:hypothetical protein